MATRRNKGSEPPGETPAVEKPRKRRTSGKVKVAPKQKPSPGASRHPLPEGEGQIVGADIVPTVEITTEPTTDDRQPTTLSDWDFHLFNEGSHHRLWEKLGSHQVQRDGIVGTMFAVWAPNARTVNVMGDWNGWDTRSHPLQSRGPSGIWEGFVPEVHKGMKYKYYIRSRHNGYEVEKADPVALHNETPPHTASIVWDLDYEWNDDEWMR